jgi:hypothetical protein
MRKNAQEHCRHDRESDGGQALLVHGMLDTKGTSWVQGAKLNLWEVKQKRYWTLVQ